MIKNIDAIDEKILTFLSTNARIATAEIARRLSMSPPSVAERIKRLEDAGVITSYRAIISPNALGRPLSIWLRIRPVPGEMHRVAEIVQRIPEITQCDRVTGDDCYLAQAHVRSVEEMEQIIDQIIPYAMTNTSVVQSSPIEVRLPPLR